MAFGDLFGKRSKRFVAPEETRRKLARQLETNEALVGKLASAGVSPEDDFRVEYYFYADEVHKAKLLASDLARLGYEVEYRASSKREGQTIVTGWTTPMSLSLPTVNGWTEHMSQLGLKYDCDFDGWGAGSIGA